MDIGRQINQGAGSTYNETHVQNIIFNSADYQTLVAEISDLEELMAVITDDGIRLKQSAKLGERRKQLEQFKQEVIKLYETFNRIAIDTERLRLAKEHFDKGAFREADAILKAEEMTGDLDRLIERERQLESEKEEIAAGREQIANEFLVKAQLWSTFYDDPTWFKQTLEYYEDSLKACRMFGNLASYGDFLYAHDNLPKARSLYEEVIGLLEGSLGAADLDQDFVRRANLLIASLLSNIGVIYKERGDFAQAGSCYRRALEIRTTFLGEDSFEHASDTIVLLGNIGNLHYAANEFSECRDYMLQTLDLSRELAAENPKALSLLARSLSNYGLFLRDTHQLEESHERLSEALAIWREVIILEPGAHGASLAESLNNMGVLYFSKKEWDVAGDYFKEALTSLRILANKNPHAYLPTMAHTIINLGVIERRKGNLPDAERLYNEALEIYKSMSQSDSDTYTKYETSILTNLGSLYTDLGDIHRAKDYFEEALRKREELAAANPRAYLPEVANSLLNLSILHLRMNEKEMAASYAKKSAQTLYPFYLEGHFNNDFDLLLQVFAELDIEIYEMPDSSLRFEKRKEQNL